VEGGAVFQTADPNGRSRLPSLCDKVSSGCHRCDMSTGKHYIWDEYRLNPSALNRGSCSRAERRSEEFRRFSLRGKLGGPHACGVTFQYMVPPPNIFLTHLFSKTRLKRKDFQEILRLPWAQEAPGSNPGAPTKNISRVFFSLLKAPFTPTPSVEFWQTGGLVAQVV